MAAINRYLSQASGVSSKAIAQMARENPSILNLSIGEPDFGPPPHMLDAIQTQVQRRPDLIDGLKRYEHSRGDPNLRQAIAAWYLERYQLVVDPDEEIVATHGGMEALNLALLAVTDPGDDVALSNPGYTLYRRAVSVLGRNVVPLERRIAEHEFDAALKACPPKGVRALLVNSPENPTGYVLSDEDWKTIAETAEREDSWVIHDEVYDTFVFARRHQPARAVAGLGGRSVLINSCSKKFGVPGLRIGWLIGPKEAIDAAVRVHESLCLGVNILAERIALLLMRDPEMDSWFSRVRGELAERNAAALSQLNAELGYTWPRVPCGGMFLFPDVGGLYQRLPARWRDQDIAPGTAVANYLLREHEIATVPGAAYGDSVNHIRITNCGPGSVFYDALARLARL